MYEVHHTDAYIDLSVNATVGLLMVLRSEKETRQHDSLASISWMLASTGDGGGRNRPTR